MSYRVVLDTNQVVAAGTNWLDWGRPSPDPNTSRRVLIKVAEAHTGLYCGKIVGEYLEKLVDLKHPRDRSLRLMTFLMGAFEQVTISTKTAPHRPADLDDEVFLLCALDGNADFLVSSDGDLLALRAHYAKPRIERCSDVVTPLGA